jgi:eukaryotic-like serine/threonine-protein kinase
VSAGKGRFWRHLGLGRLPGDPEEARALLQRRLAAFVGFLALLWVLVSVTGYVSAALYKPEWLTKSVWAGIIHNGATVALVMVWLVLRRGKRSTRTLGVLDALVTVGQACVMGSIMPGLDIHFRPDLNMTLGLATMLTGRAAVVPSRGSRTLAIGVASAAAVLAGAVALHLRAAAAGSWPMPAPVSIAQVVMWLAFVVLLSTTVSRVIYGLARQVHEAARLGQYTLERKIGQGAMGVVYLARHALLRRPTAVKLLAPEQAGTSALARFEREVQAQSGLRHPNTVAIYDYGHTPEGVFYFAMEYLDGVDLERLLGHQGPLPEGRVAHILAQVAAALDEAHGSGLIHRDIKPSNIVICDYGRQPDFVKVLDFGLVKETESNGASLSQSGVQALIGTPLYMAPEAITAPSTIDGRADLYALGAVGYALLTGAPPFAGATAVEVFGHHLHSPVVPPSHLRSEPLSPALEALVLSCLAKDREQRPSSAAELAEGLRRCPVTPWTRADARAWWDQTGPQVTALARREATRSRPSDATMAIDLAERQIAT